MLIPGASSTLTLITLQRPANSPVPLGNTTMKANGETVAYDTPVPLGPHTLLLIGDRPDGAGEVSQADGTLYAAVSNEIQFNRVQRFLVGPPIPARP